VLASARVLGCAGRLAVRAPQISLVALAHDRLAQADAACE
jgi:hypothetical protein